MKKYYQYYQFPILPIKGIVAFFMLLFLGLLGYWLIGLFSFAFAQVTYPIRELGNCRDAKECYLYCEIPENSPACWSYGKYVLHKQVLAESDEDMVKKYNITFPIAELGNCTSITSCKAYCDNPSNQQACIDFAKKKGFYQEVSGGEQDSDELLASARSELGCTSMESCHAYCEQNMEKCMEFAKRHGMHEASPDPRQMELLEKARLELGCDSMQSCQTACEQNPQRCMEFARRHGFDQGSQPSQGGQPQSGAPGGCNSEESCRKYCQEHPNECTGYSPTGGGTQYQGPRPAPGSYLGPSGCKTEEECRAYCQAHPSQCPGFNQSQTYPQPTYQYPQPTYTYEQPQSYPTYSPEQYQQYQTPQSYPTYEPQPTP